MREDLGWAAFLLMCFAVLGLTGLFGTYGPQIPLERALTRLQVLDEAQAAAAGPDAAAQLSALRDVLGPLAEPVIDGSGPVLDRIAAARATVQAEAGREAASVAHRVRVMLLSITVLAGLFGAGVMLFALKQTRRRLGVE